MRALAALLAVLWALWVPLAQAGGGPDAGSTVYVGVYLHDVSRFDQRDGVFDVDVELWAKWRGSFDPEQLRVANAAEIDQQRVGGEDDGDWHSARWRVRGTLRGVFPLHRFPVDEQTLAVVLELPERFGVLAPDLASSGMATQFSLTDWLYEPSFRPSVEQVSYPSDLGDLTLEGQETPVRRVAFEVVLLRPLLPVMLKLFLPLAIIGLVALAALFVHPEQIEARAGMGVTALLSCFAFQFTVADSLPAVAYITLADQLFIIGYLLSSAAIIATIASYAALRIERGEIAEKIDLGCRIALPLAAALAVWVAMPARLPQLPVPPEPVPEMSRTPSTRDILRIGTTQLTGVTGTPASYGSGWSVLHDDPRARRQPVFVERAPAVSNDALRFLAGGHIEVTWRLREGLTWSDDAPVQLDDLLLPREAMPDEHIVEVRTPDERTMVVVWDERLAYALDAPSIWPAHMLRPVYEEGGYDAVRLHRKTEPVPSLGPYRVTSFEAKDHLLAEANPNFIGAPPAIEHLEITYFAERTDLVRAVEAGEVDLIFPNSVTMEQAVGVLDTRPDWVSIRTSAIFLYLQPDLDLPVLSQHAVRRALLMAIDREGLAREAYGDAGRVAHVPVPGALPAGTVVTTHDPVAARQALEAAGAIGATVKLLSGSSPVDSQLADGIAADWLAAGLVVERVVVPSTSKAARARGHGGMLLHLTRGSSESPPAKYWNLPVIDGYYATELRHDAYDDEVAALIEREKRALYPERRAQLRDALFAATSDRLPTLPLLFAAERVLADPSLEGWEHGPDVPFGADVEKWSFVTGDE